MIMRERERERVSKLLVSCLFLWCLQFIGKVKDRYRSQPFVLDLEVFNLFWTDFKSWLVGEIGGAFLISEIGYFSQFECIS